MEAENRCAEKRSTPYYCKGLMIIKAKNTSFPVSIRIILTSLLLRLSTTRSKSVLDHFSICDTSVSLLHHGILMPTVSQSGFILLFTYIVFRKAVIFTTKIVTKTFYQELTLAITAKPRPAPHVLLILIQDFKEFNRN